MFNIGKYFPLLEPVSNAIVRETKEPESDTESSASEMETDEPIVKKSKILLVKNLPDDVEVDMIQILFQQYSGFVEARMVPNKKGVAFVEFGLVDEANIARNVLDGFSVNATMRMSVEFFHE